MAVGIVVVLLVASVGWIRRSGADRDDKALNTVFYGAIAQTLLFFWVWGCSTWSEGEIAHIAHAVWWPPVDALYVILAFAVGRRLLSQK